MNATQILAILQALSGLYDMRDSPKIGELKASVDNLIATLTAALPTKPGGGEWTNEDVHAAAIANSPAWQAVKDATKDPA